MFDPLSLLIFGVGAAASFIGELTKPKPPPQEVVTTTNLGALRAEAEKHGFNPVTVIRNGGLSGFTTVRHPDLEWNPVGDALKSFGNSAMNFGMNFEPFGAQRQSLEMDLLRKQIKSYDLPKSSFRSMGTFGTPAVAQKGTTDVTRIMMGGDWLPVDKGWSDAEVVTTRWGEPAEWLYSPMVIGADVWSSVESAPKFFKQNSQNFQKKTGASSPFKQGFGPAIGGIPQLRGEPSKMQKTLWGF